MQIIFNNQSVELTEGTTLEAFISQKNIKSEGSAAAVDEEIVPKKQWGNFVLHDGMRLDVFSLVAGG